MTDNDRYELAIKEANSNIENVRQTLPEDIRKKEKGLFKKISELNRGRLKKLELLFYEMDTIYSFINQFTICEKGCSHCCYNMVISISTLEIEWIKSELKINKLKRNPNQKACPFLNNGTCSIYKYRPFFCRTHNSFNDSPKWCMPDVCNNYLFPKINLSEVFKCYQYLVGLPTPETVKDIRKAFAR
ncbi:MAG: YkgJ family cysteine cluster protein [Proteobacteria bacterium]|nr:YkgJ family cysteine cluster protein [Pseudomonadota bacterium]